MSFILVTCYKSYIHYVWTPLCFFWGSNAWTGWCFFPVGGRELAEFPQIFQGLLQRKATIQSSLLALCLSEPIWVYLYPRCFFVQGLQTNIDFFLQEWPMLVEWTHHLSSFEVSALEGGDACFTEMLKARISIVHLGILWGVCGGGGCKCQHRKTQRNYSFRQVRGDAVSFPPSWKKSLYLAIPYGRWNNMTNDTV